MRKYVITIVCGLMSVGLLGAAAFFNGPIPSTPPVPTFSIRATNDTLIATVDWKQAIDTAGPADYYIVDASFNRKTVPGYPKKVVGLTTALIVPQIVWGSSGTFIADLRAVRRGLTSKATSGKFTYTRKDVAPLPPQNVTVTVNEKPN